MAPLLATEEIFIVEPNSLRHVPTGFWQVAVSAHEGDATVPKIASDTRVFFISVPSVLLCGSRVSAQPLNGEPHPNPARILCELDWWCLL